MVRQPNSTHSSLVSSRRHFSVSSFNHGCSSCFCLLVIERYQYRLENEKGARIQPDVKDFKKLNKVVLKEGATNAAVSQHPNQNLTNTNERRLSPLTLTFIQTG